MTADLRLGRYQDVLADVECDAVVTDPPFGARTHAAWRASDRESGPDHAAGKKTARSARSDIAAKLKRTPIEYASWTPEDVAAFVAHWGPRTRGWMVALTSHDLAPAWSDAFEAIGRYAFAPIPCVTWGGSIRLAGDGPSGWTVWAMVARPRVAPYAKWGTLPGAYISRGGQNVWREHGGGGGRGKPIDLMRALVRDYSRPGDLICDPCAGYGTTGRAALSMGRRFVGAECDAAAHAEALNRLGRPTSGDLFAGIG